jgi:hypothetical protein
MEMTRSSRRWLMAVLVMATSGVAFAQEPTPPPLPAPPVASPAPPQADAPRVLGPRTLEWEPGEPVPQGYRPVTQIRTGLVVAGAVTFGAVWLLNVLTASIAIDTSQGQAIPLFVPVIGPFIAMGTFRSLQAVDVFFLSLDGLVQAGGIAMLVAGIAVPKHQLVRNRYAELLVPKPVSFGNGSVGLAWGGSL